MKYIRDIIIALSIGCLHGAEITKVIKLPKVVRFPLLNPYVPKKFTWEDISYSQLCDASTDTMSQPVLQLLKEQKPLKVSFPSSEYWSAALLNYMVDECGSYKIKRKELHKTFPLEHSYHLLLAFMDRAKKEYVHRTDIQKDAQIFLHSPLNQEDHINPEIEATVQHRLEELTYEIKIRKIWVVPSAEATYLILLQDLQKYMQQAKKDGTFKSATFFSLKYNPLSLCEKVTYSCQAMIGLIANCFNQLKKNE